MASRRPSTALQTLGDLQPDPKNCRRHTPRNIGSLVDSLQRVGAGRSIVIDENNVILAGNGIVEAAGQAGIEKVQIVDAPGDTIIAVRRTGLSAKQKAELAIADNRTAELAAWDIGQLAATAEEHGLNLAGLEFTEAELAALSAAGDPNSVSPETATGVGAQDAADTQVVVGEYRFPLSRARYLEWLEDLRQEHGFDKDAVEGEIKRRLGL